MYDLGGYQNSVTDMLAISSPKIEEYGLPKNTGIYCCLVSISDEVGLDLNREIEQKNKTQQFHFSGSKQNLKY